ncbi:MAG: AAA-associated domain-containing protein [Candidatus Thorarchaeota archaeon]|nr:MAG: hypothetical protein DRP09_01515 [Candidatus Thorarchaeota archaeon]
MTKSEALESIPNVRTGQIIGLVEALVVLGNECDKEGIAHAMGIQPQSTSNILRAADILGFVTIDGTNIRLTDLGSEFNDATDDNKGQIVGEHLKNLEPFATIIRALKKGPLSKEEILNYAKAKMPKVRELKTSSTDALFRTIRSWCEFGGLLDEDEDGRYRIA